MEIAWVRFISLALLFTLPACNEARAQDSGRASAPERVSGREEVCGWVFPVESYHAEIAGLSIALTANDRLLINGRVVAENPPLDIGSTPLPWHDSANTAQVARAGDRILVLTMRTDCIDGAASRIYVLNRQGALEASNRLWSEHWRDGFFRERDSINYWSEWFCQPGPGEPVNQTYVYVLRSGASDFVRESRPREPLCSPDAKTSPDFILFGPMRPQSQQVAPAR